MICRILLKNSKSYKSILYFHQLSKNEYDKQTDFFKADKLLCRRNSNKILEMINKNKMLFFPFNLIYNHLKTFNK